MFVGMDGPVVASGGAHRNWLDHGNGANLSSCIEALVLQHRNGTGSRCRNPFFTWDSSKSPHALADGFKRSINPSWRRPHLKSKRADIPFAQIIGVTSVQPYSSF